MKTFRILYYRLRAAVMPRADGEETCCRLIEIRERLDSSRRLWAHSESVAAGHEPLLESRLVDLANAYCMRRYGADAFVLIDEREIAE